MQPKPTKPPRKPGKKRELAAWAERVRPERAHPISIAEPEWEELRRLLAPVSESYLRRLLREFSGDSGIPLEPLIEGVRQESFEALESSLLRLLKEYEDEHEDGAAARRLKVRKAVIEAKDHAKLAVRKPELRVVKEEMILWMLTWLENPGVFPDWVRLRVRIRPRAKMEEHGAWPSAQ